MVPYLRHEIVLLYPFCFVVYDNSTSIMSQIDPTLWYVLHTQLMARVTTWDIYLFLKSKYGYVGSSHLQGMLAITIHH